MFFIIFISFYDIFYMSYIYIIYTYILSSSFMFFFSPLNTPVHLK